MSRMVTVRTYVVCDGYGTEKTERTRDYVEAKAWVHSLRKQHPGEFYHIELRTEEVAADG